MLTILCFYIIWFEKGLKACGEIMPQADNMFLVFSLGFKHMLSLSHSSWKIIADNWWQFFTAPNLLKEYYCNLFFFFLLPSYAPFWAAIPLQRNPHLTFFSDLISLDTKNPIWVTHSKLEHVRIEVAMKPSCSTMTVGGSLLLCDHIHFSPSAVPEALVDLSGKQLSNANASIFVSSSQSRRTQLNRKVTQM